jgi:hypothetical protein
MARAKLLMLGLMVGLLVCTFGAAAVHAQDDKGCFILQEVVHVGPNDLNTVRFDGTNQDFTMIFNAEYDGVSASFPNAMWEVHVAAGLATYTQPEPAGSIVVHFTPPPLTWCVGEEKRFEINGTATGLDGLQYRYTPRFNYGSWAQLTSLRGIDVFAGEVLQPTFGGDGGLVLLTSAAADIKLEYLVEGSFGALIVEYRYINDVAVPGAAANAPPPVTSPGVISVVSIAFYNWLRIVVAILLGWAV